MQHCLCPLAYILSRTPFSKIPQWPSDPKGNENIICTMVEYGETYKSETSEEVTYSIDADQIRRLTVSDLGLHCYLGHVYTYTHSTYCPSFINLFMASGIFYHNSLDRSISNSRV